MDDKKGATFIAHEPKFEFLCDDLDYSEMLCFSHAFVNFTNIYLHQGLTQATSWDRVANITPAVMRAICAIESPVKLRSTADNELIIHTLVDVIGREGISVGVSYIISKTLLFPLKYMF